MRMVKCVDCGKEMDQDKRGTVDSCIYDLILIDGKVYRRDTKYFDYNPFCHDCGIANEVGNIHHFGCDMERCPKCGGQMISCGCKPQELRATPFNFGSWVAKNSQTLMWLVFLFPWFFGLIYLFSALRREKTEIPKLNAPTKPPYLSYSYTMEDDSFV